MLAAQKPINRPKWWKGKLALFQILATGGVGGRVIAMCPKANSPHHLPPQAGGESFYRWRGGGWLPAETAQPSLTISFKLIISVV